MNYKEIFVSFFLLLFLLAFSIALIAYDEGFYQEEFLKLGIYGVYGDADARMANLFSYLKYQGELSPDYFSERDILHMGDVRRLLTSAVFVAVLSLFLLLRNLEVLRRSFIPLAFSLGGIFLLLLFGIFAFERFFLYFHLASFSNEYWLMNPLQDTLVNLFPEQFFFDALLRILLYQGVALFVYGGYLLYARFFR